MSPETDQSFTEIIDLLVDAYNASDARAFAELFEENATVYEHPGLLTQQNREEIFQYYAVLFSKYPLNRTEVVHRIVIGNRIIDHERVRRSPEVAPFEVLTIYEMGAQLIKRVDFVR